MPAVPRLKDDPNIEQGAVVTLVQGGQTFFPRSRFIRTETMTVTKVVLESISALHREVEIRVLETPDQILEQLK